MKKHIRAQARVFAPALNVKPLLSVLSLVISSVAFAQVEEMNSVVVTSTRFNSVTQDNPIATQVITSDEIQESSANTVAEVLQKLGGVHTRITFTGIPDSSVDLRGFGMTGDQNTLVLVNGFRLSENEGISARLSSIPIGSIERIEILRGAGAVLYGSGATGGTINIITRAPLKDGLVGSISTLAGSHSLQDQRAGFQAKSGDLGISLNGQQYKTNNYRQGNHAELGAFSGEVRLGADHDFFALNFGTDNQKSRLPGVRKVNLETGVNQFLTDPRGITTPSDYLDSRTDFMTLRGEKRFDQLTFALDIGKRNKTRRSFGTYEDLSGTSLGNAKTDITSISPRAMLVSQFMGMKNLLTVGSDWSAWNYGSNTAGTGTAPTIIEAGKQKNQAVYFRDELFISADTRLSFGARKENLKQENIFDGYDAWTSSSASRTNEHRLVANELALQHGLGAGYSLYGRVGKSFRVANIDENRCDLYAAACGLMLKPQTSRDKEIGAQWSRNGASFRASLFEMKVNDEIHYNPITSVNINLPPTQHRGLELEGKFPINKKLDFGARYTRTSARFTDGIYSGFDSNNGFAPFTVSLTGKDVPLVPKNRLSANLSWQVAELTKFTFNMNYVGSQRFDNDQANLFQSMPSYTTADVKLSLQMGAWRFAVGVNNIFDRAYYSYGVSNISLKPTRYNVYPEDRLNGYVSAEYRFN